jgi:hypothetical protein
VWLRWSNERINLIRGWIEMMSPENDVFSGAAMYSIEREAP